MKKEKQESPAKAAKKIATKSIQQRLIKTLNTITAELGQVEIDVEKEAKKLAKKIIKNLKVAKEAEKPATPAVAVKKVETAPVLTKAKPVAQSVAVAASKKPVAKATPIKAPLPLKDAAKTPAAKTSKK